jgi:integrase
MPKLVYRTPSICRHKASGQAVVTLSGKDHYLGRFGTKEAERQYERIIGEWLAANRNLPPGDEADETDVEVAEVTIDYLEHARDYYRKNGEITGEYLLARRVHKLLKRTYGKQPAKSFGPLAFKAFRQTLIDEGKSRTTVNHYMRHVIRAFRHAAGNEKLKADVYLALKAVEPLRKNRTKAPESKPIKAVPFELVDATLPHLPPIVAAMAQLQRFSAMRPGEVVLLRPCDIDRSADVWIFKPHSHKTEHHGRPRIVPLGKNAQAVLAPYLLRSAETYCFSPQETMEQINRAKHLARTTPLSCGNRPGTNRKRKPKCKPNCRYTTQSYGRRIAEVCKAKNIKHWTPNQLRKLAATNIRKHCDLESAQIILGHQSKKTTELYYADPDVQAAINVARMIG